MQRASVPDVDVKRRRMDSPARDSVTDGCEPDVTVEPVGTAVRNWLHSIGLGQYADKLIAEGLDDLKYLQEQADPEKVKKVCGKGKGKMNQFHLDKFIRKLDECRAPIVKESASIASMPAWAPVSEGASPGDSATASPSALTPAPVSAPVQPEQSIYVVDYSQVSACVYT